MRLIAAVIVSTLVLPAVAWAKPPRCGSPEAAGKKAVSIDVLLAEKRVDPKECVVAPGTQIVWHLDKNQAFETEFAKDTPDPAVGTKLKSSRVFFHHEAKMTARAVEAKSSYDYMLTVNGEALDPVIIIDPGRR